MEKLNGLDLFSGIGGNSLALAPWVRTRAYCENARFAQSVLLSRMRDGSLPCAPIWDDVRTLHATHLGPDQRIDIIVGGFPCQDISVAGRGAGLEGERSGLFFEIVRLAKETGSPFLFLENVPAIRTRGLSTVVRALSELGYDCRWDTLSAYDVGASHRRERWFLLASHSERLQLWNESRGRSRTSRDGQAVPGNDGAQESLANTGGKGLEGIRLRAGGSKPQESEHASRSTTSGREFGWEPEPNICRVVNGLPYRVDRIKCLGNAVVPAQAREAFKRLMGLTE